MLDGNHLCHELESFEICNLFSSPIASLSLRGLAWSGASPCRIAQTFLFKSNDNPQYEHQEEEKQGSRSDCEVEHDIQYSWLQSKLGA